METVPTSCLTGEGSNSGRLITTSPGVATVCTGWVTGLAVVESSPPGIEQCAAVDAQLLDDGLRSIVDTLTAAADALVVRPAAAREPAREIALLRAADDAMLSLACATTTPPDVAAVLVRVRDDLGGSLLAATLVTETTENASNAVTQILHRAAASAVERLASNQQ
jgi:hypothetical protein